MPYFTQDFILFFRELVLNNQREWFHANKKTYEKEVKEPFRTFVQDLIDRVSEIDPDIQIDPKDAIFRINRDIRFSKDKRPYKEYVSAVISPEGKKDKTNPGLYIELTPERVRVYGGVYVLDKEQLINVRSTIASNLETFQAILDDKKFKNRYETIRGEQHKRIPKEFQEAHKSQPLIANKQFYYYTDLPIESILEDNFMDEVMACYMDGIPMRDFLAGAL